MVGVAHGAHQAQGPQPIRKFGNPQGALKPHFITRKNPQENPPKSITQENPKESLRKNLLKKLAKIQKSQRDYSDYLHIFYIKNTFDRLWIYLYVKRRLKNSPKFQYGIFNKRQNTVFLIFFYAFIFFFVSFLRFISFCFGIFFYFLLSVGSFLQIYRVVSLLRVRNVTLLFPFIGGRGRVFFYFL